MVRLNGALRALARRARKDDGFTITESVVAFGLLAITILGLLGTLSTGVRGVLIGRQRNAAEAIAKEHVERIRSAAYDRIGHDIDGDSTLTSAADPDVGGSPKEYVPFDEQLADGGSDPVVDVHQFGWTLSTPTHQDQYKLDATPYDVRIYVTHVESDAQNFKRVTVLVTTNPAGGTSDEVRLSTFVYDSDGANGPMTGTGDAAIIDAGATAHAGRINVSAEMTPPAATASTLSLAIGYPEATGTLATRANVSEMTGSGSTAWFHSEDSSGSVLGPAECTSTATTVDCEKDSATTTVDDDPSPRSTYPAYDTDSVDGKEGSVGVSGVWGIDWHGGDADSASSACFSSGGSCGASFGSGVPDGLPYAEHSGSGPDTASVPFHLSVASLASLPLQGTLVDVGGTATADSQLDQGSTGGTGTAARKTVAQAEATFAPVDVLTFTGAGTGGADLTLVSVSAGAVEATAEVGPTAVSPDVSGDPVTITVAGATTNLVVTPGTAASSDYTINVPVMVLGVTLYTVTATVQVRAQEASTSSSGTSPVEESSAVLSDWLTITVDAEVVDVLGNTLLTSVVSLDYGELSATGSHEV